MEARLERFYVESDPKLYAPLECAAFEKWLRDDGEDDPWALALLEYDMALMKVIRKAEPIVVRFPGNPSTVFEGLAERRLSETPPPPAWEVEIIPDLFSVEDFAQANLQTPS